MTKYHEKHRTEILTKYFLEPWFQKNKRKRPVKADLNISESDKYEFDAAADSSANRSHNRHVVLGHRAYLAVLLSACI